ncbi:uncharacterized protein DAT39_019815, partial [Clarias magur]
VGAWTHSAPTLNQFLEYRKLKSMERTRAAESTGEQVLSSESDTDVVIRTRNTEVSDLADTLPIRPRHASTPEEHINNK